MVWTPFMAAKYRYLISIQGVTPISDTMRRTSFLTWKHHFLFKSTRAWNTQRLDSSLEAADMLCATDMAIRGFNTLLTRWNWYTCRSDWPVNLPGVQSTSDWSSTNWIQPGSQKKRLQRLDKARESGHYTVDNLAIQCTNRYTKSIHCINFLPFLLILK